MGKAGNRTGVILGILFSVIVIYSMHLSVSAAETGSIQVNCNTERGGEKICLSGDSYAVAFIAEARFCENGGIEYSVNPDFASYDYDWSTVNTAVSKGMAEELEKYAGEHQLYFQAGQTDESGIVQFGDLAPGVYLVSRTSILPENAGYTTEPVLVGIPSDEGGKQIYYVTVDLKFDWVDKSDTPSDVVQETGRVQTGDETRFVFFLVVLVGSLLCLYGMGMRRKHRK